MQDAVQLLEVALRLPEAQRATVADGLLESLEPPGGDSMEQEEWLAEIRRRAQAALAGSPAVSWEEARAEINSRLARL